MRRPKLVTVGVASSVVETAHSTFTMDEVVAYDGPAIVPGIGDGLGDPTGAAIATFRMFSSATATTYDLYGGFDFGDFSTTSLDVQAAAVFEPGARAPKFEPVLVSHYEAGPLAFTVSGIGLTINNFGRISAPLSLEGLRDRQVEEGFVVDVEASGLATPYVGGVPNPTGVFGSILTDVVVQYEVEAATYGNGADRVKGSGASDAVTLGGGRDVFRGGGGNDVALGENGADRLFGQGGDDWLGGGGGGDRLFGHAGDDTLAGQRGKDVLNGGGGGDRLDGGGGRDVVLGKGGADELSGGAGNDRLVGGGGGDALVGGRGRDTLRGGAGDDELRGGPGADRFDFRGALGEDEVLDFRPGVDVLLMDRYWARKIAGLDNFTSETGIRLYDDEGEMSWSVVFPDVERLSDLVDAFVIA